MSIVAASLLDLYSVGEKARSGSTLGCVGVVFTLLTFALRAEERGVTLKPTPLTGVAAASWPGIRGESTFCCAHSGALEDVVEDGDDLLTGAARRGAGEERSAVVVVGSLGISGRGGGEVRVLRLVAAMLANQTLHSQVYSSSLDVLIMPSETCLEDVDSRCAGSRAVTLLVPGVECRRVGRHGILEVQTVTSDNQCQ